jgi:hypothetical protein
MTEEFGWALGTFAIIGLYFVVIMVFIRLFRPVPVQMQVLAPTAVGENEERVIFPRGSRRVRFEMDCDPRPPVHIQPAPQVDTFWAQSVAPHAFASIQDDGGQDGFDLWAHRALSMSPGAILRTGDAYQAYLTFCARNDYDRPLAAQEFGRRLRAWLAETHNIQARHSGAQGGTVYDGVSIAGMAPGLINGAA